MCNLGDIIVVKEFKNECGVKVKRHSFVVINDNKDYVEGLNYDFVANMMCSFHSELHKTKKLKYEENLFVKSNSVIGKYINQKNGFIKADQFYYFDKKKIKYNVIARLDKKVLNKLIKLINKLELQNKIINITTNLEKNVKN